MEYEKTLKNILEIAVSNNASDVHIVAGHPFILRIAGELVNQKYMPVISPEDSMGIASVLMGEERKKRFLKEKEIDFAYSFSEKARFRVNVFFQMGFVFALLIYLLLPNAPDITLSYTKNDWFLWTTLTALLVMVLTTASGAHYIFYNRTHIKEIYKRLTHRWF